MKETAGLRQIVTPQRDRIRFPHSIIDLLRHSSSTTTRIAIAATVFAWLPPAILAAIRGLSSLESFLADYAAQSRLLLVVPLLILTEPLLVLRLERIGRSFHHMGLISEADMPRYSSVLTSFTGKRDTVVVRVVMLAAVYIFVASMMSVIRTSSLMAWCFGAGGVANLSPAGSWYVLASLPLVLYLILRWVWRQLLWLWFLSVTSRLDLQLVSSHPDKAGGLGFVEGCMRGYFPFGFAIGVIVAGAVGNRIVYLHQPLSAFRYLPLLVIAGLVVFCAGPLCPFWGILTRARSQGIFQYGGLANGVGRQFEEKWLPGNSTELDGALAVPDFSATADLYSIVANVHDMNLFPVGMSSISRLAVAALAPAVPLAFIVLPFNVIMEHVLKLLF